MSKTRTLIIGLAASTLAGCCSLPYSTVQKGEHQIAGHPYKTADNCERRAPIGKFDAKCDIPLVGFRNFNEPAIATGAASVGGSFNF